MTALDTDVLVVGSGPSGSAVALRLALAGHHVTVVEKRPTPRHKACGDVLTPRALAELELLGVDPLASGGRRLSGVRMMIGGRELAEPWPANPHLPAHGATLRRDVLDELLRDRVRSAGATVLMGHEATMPVVERGFVRGAMLSSHASEGSGDEGSGDEGSDGERSDGEREIRSRFVVVADGANSRFGRTLGTTRERNWPYGIATRSYWNSARISSGASTDQAGTEDRNADSWLETWLGLPDANGKPVAGYGWVAPLGDGTVNIGVGLLSSYRDVRGVNALKLLDSFADQMAERWHIDPREPLKAPTRFRVPLGGSIGPTMGPTFLVVGDAAGAANPFNGDGVDAALMTGRLAAEVLDEALTSGNSTSLQRYPTLLAEAVGDFHKVGRLTARFLGRPAVLRPLLRVGSRSERVMGSALRIATNQLRSDQPGGAERTYALAATLSHLAPNW